MHFLDLFFPRRCVSCGKIGKYFCPKCTSKIEFITQPICPICERPAVDGITHPICQTRYSLDGLTGFFRYDGIIRQAIKEIKYHFVSDLAYEFISLLPYDSLIFFSKSYALLSQPAIFVPIPLHPSRLKYRGFNQAEVLGKLLVSRLKIPIRTNLLKRMRKTTPQVEMKDRKKRLANMDGVFEVNHVTMKQLNNVSILLFDDVFTTGATLRSAANVLKRAGAKKVWGIVLAHG